jgi:hypothetical protein
VIATATDYLVEAREAGEECRQAAHHYAELGLSVTVLCPPDHVGVGKKHGQDCCNPGKVPLHPWKELQERRLNGKEIDGLFKQNPFSNVGCALGPVSELIRVDVDGPAGEERLQELSGGALPDTWEFTSGRKNGGRGLLYRIPDGVKLKTTIIKPGEPKTELRFQAKGAQTVLPPSRHPDGGRYAWTPGHGPEEIPCAIMPPWLIGQLKVDEQRNGHSANGKAAPTGDRTRILNRAAAYVAKMPSAISGQGGHDQTFAVACALVLGFGLTVDEAWPIMEVYNERCEPPWTDKELLHKLTDADKKPDERGYLLSGTGQPSNDSRPVIVITTDEYKVNDAAVNALAAEPGIYQRGSNLVHVVREPEQNIDGITRPAGTPRIVKLPTALVTERLSSVARFVAWDARKKQYAPKNPTNRCAAAVAARGQWPGIRRLDGVVDAPVLRPDGTILIQPGYDAATGLIYEPTVEVPKIPNDLFIEDVHEARDLLLEVVEDFPFAKPEHKATWLAALLTPLARHAFDGPAPLFLVDSNVRGSGKGLLVDVTALIVTGRTMPVMSCPRDDEEFRKRITAVALEGDSLVSIDNIAVALGCASLDTALTATTWKDRLLGKSEMTNELPMRATWFATGNNVVLLADTSRRTAHIRLNSPEENPEERSGFKQPDLRGWVRANRGKLLAAALTILAGYCSQGRPNMKLKPWGSYEEWSDLVRSAVVWAGLPDPGASRQEVRERCDQEVGLLRAIIGGLPLMDPENIGLRAAEILARLTEGNYSKLPEVKALHDAILLNIESRGKDMPSARQLGMKLRHLEGRVVAGKRLISTDEHNTKVWRVTE